jgi:alkanesulfonate monooxygenase SsuD/methylene tetrahydromethanopterin reductase-like flavin-dependent oxidoreductase (luciferase family)
MTIGSGLRISYLLQSEVLQGSDIAAQCDLNDEVVTACREYGFDGYFAVQHLAGTNRFLQPLQVLARAGGIAPGCHLGTCVLLLPLHNTFVLAEDIATIDHQCGGQFILGVGAGYRDEEFIACGVDKTRRGALLGESVETLRALWSKEGLEISGQRFAIETARPGGPPIWIGATSKAAMRRAARLADTWLPAPTARPAEIQRGWKMFTEMRQELGVVPPTERPLMRDVVITDADDRALDYLRGEYERYADHGMGMLTRDLDQPEGGAFVIGNAERTTELLAEYVSQGFNHIILRCAWTGQPAEVVHNQLAVLGAEVVPRLRSLAGAK